MSMPTVKWGGTDCTLIHGRGVWGRKKEGLIRKYRLVYSIKSKSNDHKTVQEGLFHKAPYPYRQPMSTDNSRYKHTFAGPT